MRRRDLVKMLLASAAAPALLPLGSTGAFAQDGELEPPGPPSDRNNIVGLNVARLHQPLYIWAASDLVNANGGDWDYITVAVQAEYNLKLCGPEGGRGLSGFGCTLREEGEMVRALRVRHPYSARRWRRRVRSSPAQTV